MGFDFHRIDLVGLIYSLSPRLAGLVYITWYIIININAYCTCAAGVLRYARRVTEICNKQYNNLIRLHIMHYTLYFISVMMTACKLNDISK